MPHTPRLGIAWVLGVAKAMAAKTSIATDTMLVEAKSKANSKRPKVKVPKAKVKTKAKQTQVLSLIMGKSNAGRCSAS